MLCLNCVVTQVHIGTMREKSRGQLTLQSADPTMAPVLDFNYLSTEDDIRDLRACVRIARQVCSQLFVFALQCSIKYAFLSCNSWKQSSFSISCI